mmetsp:Transcript_3088/g.3516  ORF Transcript_3088/g.3516 Transcript_3088/m.3516 type:complete len:517 (+) Transcript_3088:607-2157(+)
MKMAAEEQKEIEMEMKRKQIIQDRINKNKQRLAAKQTGQVQATTTTRPTGMSSTMHKTIPGTKLLSASASSASSASASTSKNNIDTAALMMRKNKPSATVSNMNGRSVTNPRQPRRNGLGRGAAANSVTGKSLATPTSRLGLAKKLGLGNRGTMLGLGNRGTMSKSVAAQNRGAFQRSNMQAQSTNKTTTTTKPSSSMIGGRAMRNNTKMKMIDVNEVEDLQKVDKERQAKLNKIEVENRKRKMKEAREKNLLKKKGADKPTTNSNNINGDDDGDGGTPSNNDTNGNSNQLDIKGMKRKTIETNGDQATVHGNNIHDHNAIEAVNDTKRAKVGEHDGFIQPQNMQPSSTQHLQPQPQFAYPQPNTLPHEQQLFHQPQNQDHPQFHAAVDPYQNNEIPTHMNQAPTTTFHHDLLQDNYNNYNPSMHHFQQEEPQPIIPQHLLEKSNKLTPEGRYRVEQFFTNRINPTPETRIYKTKVHEERHIDQETNEIVKDTYYIELDYDTFEYKKLKKIKRSRT